MGCFAGIEAIRLHFTDGLNLMFDGYICGVLVSQHCLSECMTVRFFLIHSLFNPLFLQKITVIADNNK